jgi:hypothetical protein
MCEEGRVGTAGQVKPFSWAFGLVAQSLELATRPPDHRAIDPLKRRTQLRLLKVAVVADPAADAWMVGLG